MKINAIHIEGFGIFHDYKYDNFSPNLNLIIGDNEAGKTTFLTFIRYILFGFPTGRESLNPYPPLKGGKHGGRIRISDRDNLNYVIERFADYRKNVTITFPDGSKGDESDLARLLGHASRDLFFTLFAFSLNDLEQFETLNKSEIQSRIYSMGTGVSSLLELQKKLKKKAEDIFKKSGKKPYINRYFDELGEIQQKIQEIKQRAESYDQLKKEKEDLFDKIKRLKEEKQEKESALFNINNLLRAWEDWTELINAEKELSNLAEIPEFPPDGIHRLNRVVDKENDIISQIEELETSIKEKKKEIDSIAIDIKLINHEIMINELVRGRDKFISAFDDIFVIKEKLEDAKKELKSDIKELGVEWDENKIKTLDTSISRRDEVQKFNDGFQDINQLLTDVENRLSEKNSQLTLLKEEEAKARVNLDAFADIKEIKREDFVKKKKAIKILRVTLPDYQRLRSEFSHIEERIKDLESQLSAKQREPLSFYKLPFWPIFVFVIFMGISGYLFFRGEKFTGSLIFLFFLFLNFGYLFFRNKIVAKINITRNRLIQEIKEIKNLLKDEKEKREKVKSQIERYEALTNQHANILGIENPILAVVEEEADTLEKTAEMLSKKERFLEEYKKIIEKRRLLEKEYEKTKEFKADVEKKKKRIEEDWK
ncbi:MAG: AAA family ATPase, partial [Deltaproteobacteria bacterium]|nr:AAA family ATPase [Deltaproteobacteria bacterium]